jgi:hypothetical protein
VNFQKQLYRKTSIFNKITSNILLPDEPDLVVEFIILCGKTAVIAVLLGGAIDACIAVVPFDK